MVQMVHRWVPRVGLKVWVLRLGPKFGSHGWVPNLGRGSRIVMMHKQLKMVKRGPNGT
jgi:hypothetical protein